MALSKKDVRKVVKSARKAATKGNTFKEQGKEFGEDIERMTKVLKNSHKGLM